LAGEHPLIAELRAIAGRRHLLTGAARTRPFAQGFRCGSGPVLAVARPASLVEQWRVLRACVAADAQAANTGLTGGSTPNGRYDRPVVVISTRRITGIHLLRGGRQVICLAGATLYQLERALTPIGREPHSVIGSSCIGASVVGGVCNNSGGSLVQRGPAYTEYALYARVDEAMNRPRHASGITRISRGLSCCGGDSSNMVWVLPSSTDARLAGDGGRCEQPDAAGQYLLQTAFAWMIRR
jgi:D-lactate dehydrogenase